MGTSLVVKRITAADFEAVATLLAELGRPAVTTDSAAAVREVYERHVASPDTASLIAERDGVPVGFLSLHFRERLNQTRPEAWIPDLIVTEPERGTGVAAALFSRAVELARERGCYRLSLESGYSRERAHRFYRRQGMLDAGRFFLLPLAAETDAADRGSVTARDLGSGDMGQS